MQCSKKKARVLCVIKVAHAQGCKVASHITTSPFMVTTKTALFHAQPGTGVEDGWHSPMDTGTLGFDHRKVVKGDGA